MFNAPCAASRVPYNTGVDCQVAMSAPALMLLMDAGMTWTAEDEADFLTFLKTGIHAPGRQRIWPLFGNKAALKTITDSKENDVTVTYDDGSIDFIRNGTITRTFMTNKGGLAYARALQSFNAFGNWAFVEVDKFMNVLRKDNGDGTFSGIPLNVAFAPTPQQATFKQNFMPAFEINFRPEDYIGSGVISNSSQNLLDTMGLIDSQITLAAAASTTKLKIAISTIGTQIDLVAKFPAIADPSAFIVTDDTGAVVTISAAAVVSGHVELTGTFVADDVYTVTGSGAAALAALMIFGYEIINDLAITIP